MDDMIQASGHLSKLSTPACISTWEPHEGGTVLSTTQPQVNWRRKTYEENEDYMRPDIITKLRNNPLTNNKKR